LVKLYNESIQNASVTLPSNCSEQFCFYDLVYCYGQEASNCHTLQAECTVLTLTSPRLVRIEYI